MHYTSIYVSVFEWCFTTSVLYIYILHTHSVSSLIQRHSWNQPPCQMHFHFMLFFYFTFTQLLVLFSYIYSLEINLIKFYCYSIKSPVQGSKGSGCIDGFIFQNGKYKFNKHPYKQINIMCCAHTFITSFIP